MIDLLKTAYNFVQEGNVEAAEEAIAALKALPRTEQGIFDLSGVGENKYQTGRLVYPVYAAYETVCNKKEGYPDLLEQLRAWDKMVQGEFSFEHAALYADLLIHTIPWISQEVYEYYREPVDLFRACIKRMVETCCENEIPQANAQAASLFRKAVKKACEEDVLLAEKYGEL